MCASVSLTPDGQFVQRSTVGLGLKITPERLGCQIVGCAALSMRQALRLDEQILRDAEIVLRGRCL